MSPRDVEQPDDFTLEATPEMCCYCFDVLVQQLVSNSYSSSTSQQQPSPDYLQNLPKTATSPLFITWEKQNGGDPPYTLRGCIGTLSPRPLSSAIGEYALTAALRDRRFDPIRPDEIKELRVAVSLLVKYEPCDHVHDWEIGTHGILIKFTDGPDVGEYSATYLPEVAKEQGWTQVDAVKSLIRKSGYNGQIHDELLLRIRCTRYQSSKHRVTYPHYVESIGGTDPLVSAGVPDKKRWCFSL
mmetsp:Transcript_18049/g.29906  ORF Transcript_18049/g.29906 Transcript_18049/m.29906 type:complete len:242 (-) Transcript_18049:105-830(-)|eukprot:CAMPEP_0119006772 /NCGR_PEP_ID=MMETSP1176-20130426/2526_1 /TAXON_ID=265551 /ORGANISM="Synedropsis recta cf, Strain CCMP1620" /LENGTH=241 /DNA_ID=CAMNT_0006958761 /DNA_START=179 /DNA_END=904 /DNA_ORIENTATION=-